MAANVQPQSLAGFRPLYPLQLPGQSIDSFYGRSDDLHRIAFVLSTLRGGVEGAALTGAIEAGGGVGKTRLALEYLHRLGKRSYPGGIFWVDAAVSDDELEASDRVPGKEHPDTLAARANLAETLRAQGK